MVLREGALRLEGGQHRHLGQLGELQQLAGGVGVEHALADVEQRILAASSAATAALTSSGIGPGAPALHRRVRMLVLVVLAEVARDDQQHRARAGPSAAG